ncbi:hypothetical protein QTP86_000354 [Hemibagrus guttatus]|nr:hypothetical protein QTP86_000354 [Hemibagrus guttatus]
MAVVVNPGLDRSGCVITVSGRMTFTSNKSMEIEVFVDADQLADTEEGKYRAVTAFFTYISLDKENKPLPVPPLKLGSGPIHHLERSQPCGGRGERVMGILYPDHIAGP